MTEEDEPIYGDVLSEPDKDIHALALNNTEHAKISLKCPDQKSYIQ